MSSSGQITSSCLDPCGDTSLSIAGNAVAFATFLCAVIVGTIYAFGLFREANNTLSEILEELLQQYGEAIKISYECDGRLFELGEIGVSCGFDTMY
jgi:hypothetical protein